MWNIRWKLHFEMEKLIETLEQIFSKIIFCIDTSGFYGSYCMTVRKQRSYLRPKLSKNMQFNANADIYMDKKVK